MDFDLQPGRYVVAVSGGVDSVALLDLLVQKNLELRAQSLEKGQTSELQTLPSKLSLVVAHFDHGIRPDSAEDRRLVQALAKQYGLPFVYQTAQLGARASEATARRARYQFLYDARRASKAAAIITAHHQDDLLETAILNMLRGTARRGLSSLKSTDTIVRPLLHVPKQAIQKYAERQALVWREDSTNRDERYARNYVRRRIIPRLSAQDRQSFISLIEQGGRLNQDLAEYLVGMLHTQPGRFELDRAAFILLPHAVARELLAEWLLQRTDIELSRTLLERLVIFAKTGRSGTRTNVAKNYWLHVTPQYVTLTAE